MTVELLLVLAGTPTLRTSNGVRTLACGDVLHFPAGADGAHRLENRSAAPVRYVMTAAHGPVERDRGRGRAAGTGVHHRPSLLGEGGVFVVHELPDHERSGSSRIGDP